MGSIGGIALLITAVTSTNLFKAIKNTKNFEEVKDYVHKQALYVFLSSIFWYYIILTVILNNGIWYEILGLGIVTPILISGIFIYNTNKVQALENKKYSIRILTQDEIITLNLIHNYVIDEKRTLCTLANAPEDKLFISVIFLLKFT